jgi:hypothetical protein
MEELTVRTDIEFVQCIEIELHGRTQIHNSLCDPTSMFSCCFKEFVSC